MSAKKINFTGARRRRRRWWWWWWCGRIDQTARRWVRKHGRNLFRTWCAASIEIPLINLTFTVFRPRVDSGRGRGRSLVSQPAELPAPIYDAACSRHPTPRGGSIAANFHRFLRGPNTAHRRPSSIVFSTKVEQAAREFRQLFAALLSRPRRTTWQRPLVVWKGEDARPPGRKRRTVRTALTRRLMHNMRAGNDAALARNCR